MPILSAPKGKPFLFAHGAHLQTIIPNICRNVRLKYTRQSIELPDGDFLDLDWIKKGNKKLVIVLHGLEGDSNRHYVKGALKEMIGLGWDGVALNFRGCSGKPNRLAKSYHSGEIKDLDFVIEQIRSKNQYDTISLIGFSLGANVALMYGGKKGDTIPSEVKAIVAVSVPADLTGSVREIERWSNKHYVMKFMMSLRKKTKLKAHLLRNFDVAHILNARNFIEFDERYTAPVHGFESAKDYWIKASSLPFLPNIKVPTFILNALDDTFLSKASSPIELAKKSSFLHLMQPNWGGHVGFFGSIPWTRLWSEKQIGDFITRIAKL